jgi:ABC-type polysaccharide/polyol phosphate transport system ATPase subunit
LSAGVGAVIGYQDNSRLMVVKGLDEISLRVQDGDRLGVVGHNGAGKSTLLRTIAGIYEPSAGCIIVRGRVFPMFNASLGMDLEENGLVNMFTIGMYLGMNRREIKQKRDEIIEFSELGDFIHLPLRTYSRGMLVRLAFSVATSVDPEILLLDEDLGIGDSRFTIRVKQRVNALVDRASILVLATHDEALMREMCSRAICLDHGRIVDSGDVEEVLLRYHRKYDEA